VTSNDLRREAARREQEAAARVADAARLRAEARGLRGLLMPLVEMSRRVWAGPAATEFEHDVAIHDRTLGREADLIETVAADFEQLARRQRAEAAELRRRAEEAEIAAVAPPGAA
jgi:hypothetical protein